MPLDNQNEDQRIADESREAQETQTRLQHWGETSETIASETPIADKPIRTRTRRKPATNIRIEQQVQASLEQSIHVATAIQQQKQAEIKEGMTVFAFDDFGRFLKALNEQTFNIPPQHYLLTRKKARSLWDNYFGHIRYSMDLLAGAKETESYFKFDRRSRIMTTQIMSQVDCNDALLGISQAAMEQLLIHGDQVQQGLDLQHLPTGFQLIEKQAGLILDFDPEAVEEDSLVTLLMPREKPRLTRAMMQSLLPNMSKTIQDFWASLCEDYCKEATELFLKHVLALNTLAPEAFKQLMDLCGDLQTVESRMRLTLFMEHRDAIMDLDEDDLLPTQSVVLKQQVNRDDTLTFHSVDFSEETDKNNRPYDKRSPGRALLDQYFPKVDLDTLCNCAVSISHVINSSEVTDSLELPEGSKQLLDKLKVIYWAIELNQAALLKLEAYLPSKGIELLCEHVLAAPTLIQWLDQHYLQKTENYFNCLKPEFKEALQTIESLNETQFAWWQALFEKHAASEIDLVALVRSFMSFIKAIEDRGLSFYPLLPNAFEGISNMQVAMAHSLTLLNSCDPRDITVQWKAIPALKLTQTGVMRYVNKKEAYCGILLPEMHMEEPDLDFRNLSHKNNATLDLANQHKTDGYDLSFLYQPPPLMRLDQIKRDFFRDLAKARYRLPITFYQDAFETLVTTYLDQKAQATRASNYQKDPYKHDLDDNIFHNVDLCLLHSAAEILLRSTTGIHNYFSVDEETLKLNWCDFFNKLHCLKTSTTFKSLEGIGKAINVNVKLRFRSEFYGDLSSNLSFFPLPFLSRYCVPILHELLEGSFEIFHRREFWIDIKYFFRSLEEDEAISIYQGMKFYREQSYKPFDKKDIFYQYGLTLKAFKMLNYFFRFDRHSSLNPLKPFSNEEYVRRDIPSHYCVSLIFLISTFNMLCTDDQDADFKVFLKSLLQWIEVLEEKIGRSNVLQLLAYLKHINRNTKEDGSQLTKEDLISLIKDFNTQKQKDLITSQDLLDYLKDSPILTGCFPENFFESFFTRPELDAEAQRKLDQSLNRRVREKIEILLGTLVGTSDFSRVLRKLETLLKAIHEDKRLTALEVLSHQAFLPKPLPIQQFEALLDAVLKRGQVDDLIYYLHGVDETRIELATFYLAKLIPQLNENLSPVVPHIEILALLKKIVLKSDFNDLSSMQASRKDQQQINAHIQSIIDNSANQSKAQDLFLQLIKLRRFPRKTVDELKNLLYQEENYLENQATLKAKLETLIQKEPLNYEAILFDYHNTLLQIAEERPQLKSLLINYFKAFDAEQTKLITLFEHAESLQQFFTLFDDLDTLRALLYHSMPVGGKKAAFSLHNLLNNVDAFIELDNQAKQAVCRTITALLNVGRYESDELSFLIQFASDETKLSHLTTFYAKAPFPKLSVLKKWHEAEESLNKRQVEDSSGADDEDEEYDYSSGLSSDDDLDASNDVSKESPNVSPYDQKLKVCYHEFDKDPFKGENETDQANFLNQDFFKAQAKLFQGYTFDEALLKKFYAEIINTKRKSTQTLQKELTAFRDKKDLTQNDIATLVALTASLLYRATGQKLNATQYLSAFASLAAGKHVFNEVETGGGKSRIFAVLAGCEFALGHQVILLTSNIQLAMRDYLAYLAYYQLLNAKSNLLTTDLPPSDYASLDIVLSDVNQYALFCNQTRAEGKGAEAFKIDKSNQALLVDEGDLPAYNLFSLSFNYAASSQKIPVDWLYPIFVKFFEQTDEAEARRIQTLYVEDIDGCTAAFREYASRACVSDQSKLKALQKVSDEQIEIWLDSAMQAKSLIFNQNFKINAHGQVLREHGVQMVSQVWVHDIRTDKQSRFSKGVHQILSARLELLRQGALTPKAHDSAELMAALKACQHSFLIEDEKAIIFSASSKDLFEDHAKGTIRMLSGTAGSLPQLQEMQALYGHYQEKNQYTPLAFISTPRHHPSKREVQPIYLAANFEKQCDSLFEYIMASYQKSQPVLLFCENDIESQRYDDAIQKRLTQLSDKPQIQHVIDTDSYEDEATAIKQAGEPNMLTITTPIFGRGTDIKLADAAKTHGLNVLLTYFPEDRCDYEQMIGRAARFGARGEARLVLNKEALKKQFNQTSLRDDFYTRTESYLREAQDRKVRENQKQRQIRWIERDFNRRIRKVFFKDYLKGRACPEADFKNWSKFLSEQSDLWVATENDIFSLSLEEPINFDLINEKLREYRDMLQSKWLAFKQTLSNQNLGDLPELALTDKDKQILNLPAEHASKKTSTYRNYDKAQAGRAALYQNPRGSLSFLLGGQREPFANSRAWKNGRGILWANLRAWWRGDMSFWEYLRTFALINWIASCFQSLTPTPPPESALRSQFTELFKDASSPVEVPEPDKGEKDKAPPAAEVVNTDSEVESSDSDNEFECNGKTTSLGQS